MRIQLIIFFTLVYMNTNTVFSQDFVNICVKRVEFDVMYSSIFPLLLLNIPELKERHWYV